MNHKHAVSSTFAQIGPQNPDKPFDTSRSARALNQLREAYREGQSLVILNSGWRTGSDQLMKRFLKEVGEETAVVTIAEGCESETAARRELVRPIGLDPEKVAEENLDNVFIRFLTCQKKYRRRTIVVFEENKNSPDWIRRQLRRLLDLEAREGYGLLVILSRCTIDRDLTNQTQSERIWLENGAHISLAPFTLADTRKFVQWRIDAGDFTEIVRVFDFEAITLLHELCEGVPDAVDSLCCAAINLANNENVLPISTSIVMKASTQLWLHSKNGKPVPVAARPRALRSDQQANGSTETDQAGNEENLPVVIVTYRGKRIRKLVMKKSRMTIGRSDDNDICIKSGYVSRNHAALVRDGNDIAIFDLDSMNGTKVNSNRIRARTLSNKDEIEIGHHKLTLLDPNLTDRVSLNGIGRVRAPEPDDLDDVDAEEIDSTVMLPMISEQDPSLKKH